jgi:predicted murein hydrolase (TIGR00659 family)
MIIPLLCLVLTLGIYWSVKRFYVRFPKIYFTPLLVTPLIIVILLLWSKVPYETFHRGTQWLSDMIGPATAALAVPVYKNFHVLKKHATAIVCSVLFGSTIAIISSAWIAKELHLNRQMIESLAPRSATTPIAMAVSHFMGGIPTITAVIVMITGLLGMIMGPLIIRLFRIRNDVARGVLFGTGAHAAGTSKAFEFGTVAGSISSIAMVLTAFFTLCTVSWVMAFIL